VGVVGGIVQWNYALQIAAWKVAGCPHLPRQTTSREVWTRKPS